MHQTQLQLTPQKRQPTSLNIFLIPIMTKALCNQNKELFYYKDKESNKENIPEELKNISQTEAIKLFTNLDTVYFNLNNKEKKLYKHLEKIILQYAIEH